MKARYLLRQNIEALLNACGHTRHDLAVWCRRTDSWLSQIFTDDKRDIPLKYLDRIADFFGIATYQLFQPGISPLLERRKAERRSGRDRRVSRAFSELHAPNAQQLAARFVGLTAIERRKVEAWMEALELERVPRRGAGPPDDPPQSAEPPVAPARRIRAVRQVKG